MKSRESFEKDLLICNHCRCGFCREECPVYRATRIEGVSPKGRMEIIEGYYEGYIEPSEKLYKRLSLCARCSDCTVRCPIQKNKLIERFDVRVEPSEATDAILADLVECGHAPYSIIATRENVVKGHNLFRQSNKDRDKWMDSMEELPPDRYRKEHAEVLYFVGCISSFPAELKDIAIAFTKILQKSGTDFAILGEEEWCCGALPKAVGLKKESEELKAHNIEQVKKLGATKVVFNCPTCYAMWATEYKLDGIKLMHSTQFIEELIKAGKLELEAFDGKVTYHDPCDLGRRMKVYDSPRKVLRSIPEAEFIELRRNCEEGLCCGGGRLLDTTHPDTAGEITGRLAGALALSGADVVVDACPQCKRMIAPKTPKAVMDIVEVVLQLGKFNK
jgi:heterodisulfide reductase subunit D